MTTDQHLEKLTEAVAALTVAVEQLSNALWTSDQLQADLRHVVACLDAIDERDDTPELPINVLSDPPVVRDTVLPLPTIPGLIERRGFKQCPMCHQLFSDTTTVCPHCVKGEPRP